MLKNRFCFNMKEKTKAVFDGMMYFTESEKQLPILYDVDVLIVGAGPAGIGAAVRAARMGCKTMLVEAQGALGGISTVGMMSHWGGSSSSKIYQEIQQRSAALHENIGDAKYHNVKTHIIDPEQLKCLLSRMMQEARVQILLYTLACGAVVENGRITGVIIQNKTGRSVIRAKAVVDASGDGDVAAYAGVPFCLGREDDHKMQPCTLMFKVAGVDYQRAVFPESFETTVQTEKGELQALAKKLLPFPAGHVLLYKSTLPGVVTCNMTNCINIDGTTAEGLTAGTMVCQSQLEPIVRFLREYVPGYEHCYLISSASLLGIRETRHFKGLQTLTEQDILQPHFDRDWVVREAYFNFDVHNLTGPSLDKTGLQHGFTQTEAYCIPYGCLLPQKVDGLLLSGRNISGSHLAHSNFRIMTVCMAIGEASGAAAALSVISGRSPRDIFPTQIQQIVSE